MNTFLYITVVHLHPEVPFFLHYGIKLIPSSGPFVFCFLFLACSVLRSSHGRHTSSFRFRILSFQRDCLCPPYLKVTPFSSKTPTLLYFRLLNALTVIEILYFLFLLFILYLLPLYINFMKVEVSFILATIFPALRTMLGI